MQRNKHRAVLTLRGNFNDDRVISRIISPFERHNVAKVTSRRRYVFLARCIEREGRFEQMKILSTFVEGSII